MLWCGEMVFVLVTKGDSPSAQGKRIAMGLHL